MNLTIRIDCSGAAFTDPYEGTPWPGPELAEILRALADRAEAGELGTESVRDSNGNTCGSVEFDTEGGAD